MRINRRCAALGLVILVTGASCSQSGHDYRAKKTIPVTGRLTIDGKAPGSPVTVTCHPIDGPDLENPTISQTLTDDDGNFALSTYESGDGVPQGEYKLTFFWGRFNKMSMRFVGPDKLKNRYNKPEKSDITLSITDSRPIDLGEIALKTK